MLFADDSVAVGEAWRIGRALEVDGGVPDFRSPDIVRLAPVAFYNSYTECVEVAQRLPHIVVSRVYQNLSAARDSVT